MNLFGLCLKLSKKQNCTAPYLALFEQILDQCLTSGFVQMCEGERERPSNCNTDKTPTTIKAKLHSKETK